jgi:ATP-dependent RNA helicase RhlE
MTAFTHFGLLEPICRAVAAQGYSEATPIQERAIPAVLAGRDVLGVAQTGTGKTAAFALPILHRLASNKRPLTAGVVRALVLTPTRELAVQVGGCFGDYAQHLRLKHFVVTGGVGMNPQLAAVQGGLDVLVATPGRLLDLVARRAINLNAVETFVLDEADRMLDMGFIYDVRKIVAMLPKQRLNLLFSATMPPTVATLAATILKDHERIEVTPQATTVERIEQRVLFVNKDKKRDLLVDLLRDKSVNRAIVFARTKHGANRLAEQLMQRGIKAQAIHGNKSQGARQRALSEFQAGSVLALVATDLAARGIDVEGVTHVINYELPNEPESYVHRIGRTARAGADGIALSFCDAEEIAYLRAIEKTIRQVVPVDDSHAYHCPATALLRTSPTQKPPRRPMNNQRPMAGRSGGQTRRAA